LSNRRFLILSCILVLGIGASFVIGKLGSPFSSAGFRELRIPFSEFPRQVGRWVRSEEEPLSPREQEILAQDHYMRRIYSSEDGEAVRFFVCYYGNKERGLGAIYHNPTICLPAAGWSLVDSDRRRISLRAAAREFDVSIDRFRKVSRELFILNFVILDGDVLAQSPRNEPSRLAWEKAVPSAGPGYFVRVEVVPLSMDGASAREAAVSFIEEAGSYIFRHF
jgi:EpsI family protein